MDALNSLNKSFQPQEKVWVHPVQPDGTIAGYLWKKGDKAPLSEVFMDLTWKNRYFRETEPGKVYYFESQKSQKPKGFIDLNSVTAIQVVTSPTFGLTLQTPGRLYILHATCHAEKNAWVEAFRQKCPNAQMLPQAPRPGDPPALGAAVPAPAPQQQHIVTVQHYPPQPQPISEPEYSAGAHGAQGSHQEDPSHWNAPPMDAPPVPGATITFQASSYVGAEANRESVRFSQVNDIDAIEQDPSREDGKMIVPFETYRADHYYDPSASANNEDAPPQTGDEHAQ